MKFFSPIGFKQAEFLIDDGNGVYGAGLCVKKSLGSDLGLHWFEHCQVGGIDVETAHSTLVTRHHSHIHSCRCQAL